jgi:hypothetical protein
MNQFVKTKDFLVLLRVRIHTLLNSVLYEQFNLNQINERVPLPLLLCNLNSDLIDNTNNNEKQSHSQGGQTFKFNTD